VLDADCVCMINRLILQHWSRLESYAKYKVEQEPDGNTFWMNELSRLNDESYDYISIINRDQTWFTRIWLNDYEKMCMLCIYVCVVCRYLLWSDDLRWKTEFRSNNVLLCVVLYFNVDGAKWWCVQMKVLDDNECD